MNISLTINAENVDHLKAELRSFLEAEAQAPALAIADTPTKPEPEIIPPKKPAKATKKAEPVTVEATATEVIEAAKPVDIESLRGALKKVAEKDGLGREAVFKLLGEFGATNATTVRDIDRAAVIQKANELVGG